MLKPSWTAVLTACLAWLTLTYSASSEVLLPGVLDVTPIPGAHIVSDCGPVILRGDAHAGNIACVYFLDEHGSERMGMNGPSAETLTAWLDAMKAAGWEFAHLAVYEFYFERPKAGTDCSDVVMMVALPDIQVRALVESSPSNGPYDGRPWRAFAIPASTSEACGALRHVG
jgi:hypothetical protein